MRTLTLLSLAACALSAFYASASPAAPGTTELISIRDPSIPSVTPTGYSEGAAVSGDGRVIVFDTNSPDILPPGESNALLALDRTTGRYEPIHATPRALYEPSIDYNGRFIAFVSDDNTLAPGDTNPGVDIFVYDRQTRKTTLVSVSSTGEPANNTSGNVTSLAPSISADGRFVAFMSNAENFAPGLSEDVYQVFVHDRETGATTLLSANAAGVPGDEDSFDPSISGDGRHVAFASFAGNLVPNDTNEVQDVFVRDLATNTLALESVSSSGAPGNQPYDYRSSKPALSADGRYVVFASLAGNLAPGDTNSSYDIYLRDRTQGTTKRISLGPKGIEPNYDSYWPSIDAAGRNIIFVSDATNLLPDKNTASYDDVYAYDRSNGSLRYVSVSSQGKQGHGLIFPYPAISASGQFAVFVSDAPELVPNDRNNPWTDVFVRDLQASTTTLVSVWKKYSRTGPGDSSVQRNSTISADGRYVVFLSESSSLAPGDENTYDDVYLRDRQTGTTTLISTAPDGSPANSHSAAPTISANGRFIAYFSSASNLVPFDDSNWDVFVYDRETGRTELVSQSTSGIQGNSDSEHPSISADGRYVAFWSYATNLVPQTVSDSRNVYVRDRQTGVTTLAGVSSDGTPARGGSVDPFISANGRYVGFVSYDRDLVPGDDNNNKDVFVHDLQTHTTERVSGEVRSQNGSYYVDPPALSADGRYVMFASAATLFAEDPADGFQIYLYDRQTQKTQLVTAGSDGLGNGDSTAGTFSGDGRYLAFSSFASNLVPGDTNERRDIFVYDRVSQMFSRENLSSTGAEARDDASLPSLSGDGSAVVFSTWADNLTADDLDLASDVFVRNR